MAKFLVLISSFFFIVLPAMGDDETDIKAILLENAGLTVGKVVETVSDCQLRIYKPGEFESSERFWTDIEFEFLPNIRLAPYPNNGFVYKWVYDGEGQSLTYFLNEDLADHTTFSFDRKTKKILRFKIVHYKTQWTCQF